MPGLGLLCRFRDQVFIRSCGKEMPRRALCLRADGAFLIFYPSLLPALFRGSEKLQYCLSPSQETSIAVVIYDWDICAINKLQLAIQAVAPRQGEAKIYYLVDPCSLLACFIGAVDMPVQPAPEASCRGSREPALPTT